MAQLTSRFTPSLLDEDTLGRLFVHRHDLVQDAVGRMERSEATDERAHRLFVGSRGAGKTHLISLIFHRARRLQDAGARLQVAWLSEDPWGIDGYDDLLIEILQRIGLPDSDNPEPDVLRAVETGGPIVVLAENFDQILKALGGEGQRRLRALLENHRPFLFISSSTRLTSHLINQAEPFYGFFDTMQLEPFELPEATAMLQAIARVQGDSQLEHRLGEPSAQARLAAVRHLAGGQPRVWALLGTGLTAGALDELVDVLMLKFDDLTPYYQEQLQRLSGNERKVIHRLADSGRAMTVRELAASTRVDQKSLARTATELRRNGWIHPRSGLLADHVDRRLTYYELAEPLVRLAFQLKASQGKPVKLILEFLTAWFDLPEISAAQPRSPMALSYLTASMELLRTPQVKVGRRLADRVQASPSYQVVADGGSFHSTTDSDPAFRLTLEQLDDAVRDYQAGDARGLLAAPTALSQLIEARLETASPTRIRIELGLLAVEAADPRQWAQRADSIIEGAPAAERPIALALAIIARAGQPNQVEVFTELAVDALAQHGSAEASGEIVGLADRILQLGHISPASRLADAARAEADFDIEWQLISIQSTADIYTGDAPRRVGRWTDFVARAAQAEAEPACSLGRNQLAAAYRDAHQLAEAQTLGRENFAAAEHRFGPDSPHTLTCRNTLATTLQEIGEDAEALALFEQNIADSERVLGPDHPNTLACRNNLAAAYRGTGQLAEAVALYEPTLRTAEQTLGAADLNTATIRNNLALAYRESGRLEEARNLYQVSLMTLERIFGTEHPATSDCGWGLAQVNAELADRAAFNDAGPAGWPS